MQEPSDHLPTQATAADEAHMGNAVVSPQEAAGELSRNAETQNGATDKKTATTATPQVESSLNEKGSQAKSAASDTPAVNSAPDGTPQEEPPITPMLDLMRIGSDREIQVVRIEVGDDKIVHLTYGCVNDPSGRRHRVPPLPLALYWSLILATSLGKFKSTRELFDSIATLLRDNAMLPEKESLLLAYWSMATWFMDFLPYLPAVVVTGPAAAADRLLRTLLAVCRRPVLLADVSPAVLRAIPLGELMPTLLIREPQATARMAALLDASNQPGYWVYSGKDFQRFYFAKCIYTGEHIKNPLLAANNIHIHAGGNSRRALRPLPSDEVIQDFQSRLLFYRFLGHDRVAASRSRGQGFQFRPEISAMAEALQTSIVEDAALQRGVMELLPERDEQSRVDRASGWDGMVLRAVLWHCHQPDQQQQLFVREIAATVNRIYSEEGESLKISSETVGHVLKNLGLYTRRLGNAGRGLVLDKTTQARAHELGYANDVLPDSSGVSACGHCHKLQVIETAEVV